MRFIYYQSQGTQEVRTTGQGATQPLGGLDVRFALACGLFV